MVIHTQARKSAYVERQKLEKLLIKPNPKQIYMGLHLLPERPDCMEDVENKSRYY